MSTPAHHTMEVNTPASIAAFQAKSTADKVLSYMWYIHVLVSVNTEARLRARIAPVLEDRVALAFSNAASPEDFTYVQQTTIPDGQGQHQPAHDLTDHLVLWLFNHAILARLVATAPVFAKANSYARILADVPVRCREEFCRRLYTLLFSKRIVEWPHGIDVPEPAIAAAEPIVVDIESEDTTHFSSTHEQADADGAERDEAMEDQGEGCASMGSSLRRAASSWMGTPSLGSWDGDDTMHTERAAYVGTGSNPLPKNYFADWEWSRTGCGPQASVDDYHVSGEQLKAPFSSPQEQGGPPNEVLEVSP